MDEGRYAKLGRFNAEFLMQVIELLPPEIDRRDYLKVFLEEFESYSDKGRKRGEPENEGCVRELDGLEHMNILDPRSFARWLKEHDHTKYQKSNVGREREAFSRTLNALNYLFSRPD